MEAPSPGLALAASEDAMQANNGEKQSRSCPNGETADNSNKEHGKILLTMQINRYLFLGGNGNSSNRT